MAFDTVPPKPAFDIDNGIFLECAIVKHSADHGRNPAYKIQVSIRADQGKFQGLDVFYTMQSGQVFNRTEQHPDGTTWTSMPKSFDWFWAGDRNPTKHSQVGHLYHNFRDGWVYTEDIPKHHGGYHMTANCHESNAPEED